MGSRPSSRVQNRSLLFNLLIYFTFSNLISFHFLFWVDSPEPADARQVAAEGGG